MTRKINTAAGARELDEAASERIGELLATRRWCYVIPVEAFVEGHGFRVSIAIEREAGHRPTGSLDVLSADRDVVRAAYRANKSAPYFWGMTYEEAQAACKAQNAKLGWSERDVALIVASTIRSR